MVELIRNGERKTFGVSVQIKIWRQDSKIPDARIWTPTKGQKIIFHSKLQYDPGKENHKNV